MPHNGPHALQKAGRLKLGPLRPPRTVTDSARIIRLFMAAYAGRSATRDAILDVASSRPYGNPATRRKVEMALHEINTLGIPRNHKDLCGLVAHTPALKTVISYAWRVDDPDIIPHDAIPSDKVIEACMAAYHQWIGALSRFSY